MTEMASKEMNELMRWCVRACVDAGMQHDGGSQLAKAAAKAREPLALID